MQCNMDLGRYLKPGLEIMEFIQGSHDLADCGTLRWILSPALFDQIPQLVG